jgi:cell division septum initiation protein DivIVA
MADNATLRAQYLAQVEADLERNIKEKERISADLAALQAQLTTLEQDHALLVGVQQTLTNATSHPVQGGGRTAPPADVAPPKVPRARKHKAAARVPEQSAAKKTKAADKTAAAGGGDSATATHTLVELVTADLTGHSEPRSAAEVSTALTHAHPERKIQTTVVRNTLEALVAKGQALRSKQGRSVFYTAPGTTPATGPATEGTTIAA